MGSYKKIFIIFFIFFRLNIFAGPLYKPAPGPFFEIIKSGKVNSQIIIPSKPSHLEEFAASELQKYFKMMSQAELPIIKEGIEKNYSYSFFIGNTRRAIDTGIKPGEEKMGSDGFRLKSIKDGIILLGKDDLGSLFAVYELLERYFDIRWFMPGEMGLFYPINNTLKIGQVNMMYEPSFRVRWISSGDWALHQRMNVYVTAGGKKVGINWKWNFHTFAKLIPPDKYYAGHPEYFAMVNGKRTVTESLSHGNQLCTSNPDVIREVANNIIDTLNKDPGIEVISLSPNDGGGFCECENCCSYDEPDPDKFNLYTNRLAIFNNEVAKIVKEKYPKVLIKVGAYAMYTRPPLNENYLPESNLLFQLCHLYFCHNHPLGSNLCKLNETYKPAERFLPNTEFEKILDRWLTISPHVFIYEYYSISGMSRTPLPWPLIHTMRTDIPFYRDKGIEGFYTQTSDDWGRLGLSFYIAAKLCWNADLDVDDLLDDYFEKFYGPASAPIKVYFLTMEKSMQDWNKCVSYGIQGVAGLKGIGPEIFNQETMKIMDQNLIQAEREVVNDLLYSGRVAMIRRIHEETREVIKGVM